MFSIRSRGLSLTIDQQDHTNQPKYDLHVLLKNIYCCRNGSPRFQYSLSSEHGPVLLAASIQYLRVSAAVRMVVGHEGRKVSFLDSLICRSTLMCSLHNKRSAQEESNLSLPTPSRLAADISRRSFFWRAIYSQGHFQ
jgi:hypothetical protein